jgi:hypothetical protein
MHGMGSPSDIAFGGALSFRRFASVQKALLPWWMRAYVVVPCVVYLLVINGHEWRDMAINPFGTLIDLFWAVAVLMLGWGIVHVGRRRAWKQVVRLHGDITGSADREAVRWKTSLSEATFAWEKFIKLRRRPDMLLLYYSPRCALYFPREFFGSEEAWTAFGALAAGKLTPANLLT